VHPLAAFAQLMHVSAMPTPLFGSLGRCWTFSRALFPALPACGALAQRTSAHQPSTKPHSTPRCCFLTVALCGVTPTVVVLPTVGCCTVPTTHTGHTPNVLPGETKPTHREGCTLEMRGRKGTVQELCGCPSAHSPSAIA
jgi:hypothetical protein